MSPLGTLEISSKKSLLNFNNLSPMYCVGGSNNAVATPSSVPITTNDHLIKLMSLSLVNEVRGPAAALNLSPPRNFLSLHNHQNIIQPLTILNLPNPIRSPSFTEMLLKSGHLPGGSPIQIPSPNSSGSGHPESPRSTADTGMTPPPPPIISCITTTTTNDDDEVLSIGRDDDHQQLLQDCDNSSVISDEDMKSTTTAKDFNNLSQGDDNNSQGSMEYDDLHDDRSSQNSSESHSHNPNLRRNRQYSSEDSFTIKSLCSPTPNYHHNNNSNDTTTSTASPPPTNTINSNNNGSSNNNNNTNGSISNNRHSSLLFSIANILRPDFGLCNNTTTSPFAPGKSLKSPPITDFNYKRSHNHHQTNHKGSGRNDSLVVNPIDLSRPSSTGSQKHHHHQNQHKISSSGRSGGGGGNSNGNSSSGNKRLKLNNESANSLTKGNSNSEKNNSASNNNNNNSSTKSSSKTTSDGQTLWPAWVYCTRYSDRPSSGE